MPPVSVLVDYWLSFTLLFEACHPSGINFPLVVSTCPDLWHQVDPWCCDQFHFYFYLAVGIPFLVCLLFSCLFFPIPCQYGPHNFQILQWLLPTLSSNAFGHPRCLTITTFLCLSMDNKENKIFALTIKSFYGTPMRYTDPTPVCLLTRYTDCSQRHDG